MKTTLLLILTASLIFTGCVGRQAYYVSPFNGMMAQYRSTPMKADSIKAATYVNAVLLTGGDNEGQTDAKFSFSTALSRSHNLGNFQARYGAGISLGKYRVAEYDSTGNDQSVNHVVINNRAGKYSFGGIGFDGGINFVQSSGKTEWRVIGMETSLFREFGDYLDMRKALPDSVATVIVRSRFLGTVGLFTELVGKTGGSEIGGKFGYGYNVGRAYNSNSVRDSWFFGQPVRYRYYSFAFHLTRQQWTGFFQTTFGGKSANALFGMNFRLGK